jgi:colanic acid biosynthesis glycosyl transferase WcaI
MGRGHDIETLLGAARLLSPRQDITFIWIGDGAKRALVEAAARELPNVRLGAYQPRELLSESLSAADIHLVALAPELEGLIEPSKVYGIMAAGRPVLFVGPSRCEVARTIEREGCGCVIPNGNSAQLASVIAELAEDPRRREAMGSAGRQALGMRYTRKVATRAFIDVLQEISSKR